MSRKYIRYIIISIISLLILVSAVCTITILSYDRTVPDDIPIDLFSEESSNENKESSTPNSSSEIENTKTAEQTAQVNENITIEPSESEITPNIPKTQETTNIQSSTTPENSSANHTFRNDSYLTEHFNKHGNEFGYSSTNDYLLGANKVINSSEALHKIESEDGDSVYYLESTNEFVVVSTDGYLRTYFKPSDGINYYNRQ